MKDAQAWIALRMAFAEQSAQLEILKAIDEATSRGMALSGSRRFSQVHAGLETIQQELDAILKDVSLLPRLGCREQKALRIGLMAFVTQTYASVVNEASEAVPGITEGLQSVSSGTLQRLQAAIVLWDDLMTQRRHDQLIGIAWDVVRMAISAALGVPATLLLT